MQQSGCPASWAVLRSVRCSATGLAEWFFHLLRRGAFSGLRHGALGAHVRAPRTVKLKHRHATGQDL
eukprot:2031630-Prymnesium_polylepis.1